MISSGGSMGFISAGAAHPSGAAGQDIQGAFDDIPADGTGRGHPAGTPSEEHGFAHRLAFHIHRIEHIVDGSQGMVLPEHGGMHPGTDPFPVFLLGDAQQLDHIAQFIGIFNVREEILS